MFSVESGAVVRDCWSRVMKHAGTLDPMARNNLVSTVWLFMPLMSNAHDNLLSELTWSFTCLLLSALDKKERKSSSLDSGNIKHN